MNREIKFRAWDDKDKKWLLGYEYPALGGFSMFGEAMLFDEWSNIINRFILQQKDRVPSDLILMQFTGLYDKNDKPIYEGDIVGCVTKQFEFPNLGIVEYLEGSFGIYCGKDYAKDDLPKLYTWFHYNKDFEVIGNIYEHPELIKSLNNQP